MRCARLAYLSLFRPSDIRNEPPDVLLNTTFRIAVLSSFFVAIFLSILSGLLLTQSLLYALFSFAIIAVLSGTYYPRQLAVATAWGVFAILFGGVSILTGWEWQKVMGMAWGMAWGMSVLRIASPNTLYAMAYSLAWGGMVRVFFGFPVLPNIPWGVLGFWMGTIRLPVWLAEVFLPHPFLNDELIVLPHPGTVRWLKSAVKQDLAYIATIARNPHLRWSISSVADDPIYLLGLLHTPPRYIAPSDVPCAEENDEYYIAKIVFAELGGKPATPYERVVYFLTTPLRKPVPEVHKRFFATWYELLELASSTRQQKTPQQMENALVNAINATKDVSEELTELLKSIWVMYTSSTPVAVPVPDTTVFEDVADYIRTLNSFVCDEANERTPLPPTPTIQPFSAYLQAIKSKWENSFG